MQDANRYHGYFVLISNKEKDPFECLRKYRKRETIESFFEAGKQNGDKAHDTKAILDDEAKLKSWLCNTPLYLHLLFFSGSLYFSF